MKLMAIMIFGLLLLSACTAKNNSQLANPASKFCIDKGGTLEIQNEKEGQSGVCILKDGTRCDEWEYFRGECPRDYDVTEVLALECSSDQECVTPGEYMARSNCPYTTKCIDSKCTVVCPKFDGEKYPQVKECGECPQIMPPGPNFCPAGRIVAGEKDECGCQLPPKCEPVVCTMDAKQCPDGSFVGRTAPDCEFAPCPGE